MPEPTKNVRLTLELPDTLKAEVEQAAADEGAAKGRPVSVSEWVRGVLEQAVK